MNAEQLLTSLAGLASRTDASEQKILEAAVSRREEVDARLEAIRPDAILHAADEYQRLVEERGRLDRVIAQAKKHGARLPA